jgi:DNA replication protein DnaC
MLHQQTLYQLKALRLDGMARAFEEQLTLPLAAELAFEDRFAQLVDRELHWRDNQRRDRLLKQAKLKHPQACLEDVDHRPGRGLDKALIATLAGGDWIRQGHALLIGGATGTGKTWLACALGQQACRQGFSTFYARLPRLLDTLRIAHGDGSFGKRLAQLARLDVLILDDWGLTPLDPTARHDLLEVIDDRSQGRATIITSQLPVEHWHGWLNDPTLADAILDRLVHQAYRLNLKGDSLRKSDRQKTANEIRS